jgi:hypothetical protein
MINDVKETILERIKNPFLGSLIVIWLLLNWKAVFYLFFSDLSIETRFYNIENHYYSFFRSVLIPPLLAFIYTAYKDLVFDFIENESRKSESKRRNNNNAVLKEKYAEKAELATAKAKIKHIEEEYKVRNELTVKIDELERQINSERLNSNNIITEKSNEILKLYSLKNSYKNKVELMFDYYTKHEAVRNFLNQNVDLIVLDNLGKRINFAQQNLSFSTIKEIKDVIKDLELYNIGEFELDNNGMFTKMNLNIVGQYLLHRNLFKELEIEGEKINFSPNIKLSNLD